MPSCGSAAAEAAERRLDAARELPWCRSVLPRSDRSRRRPSFDSDRSRCRLPSFDSDRSRSFLLDLDPFFGLFLSLNAARRASPAGWGLGAWAVLDSGGGTRLSPSPAREIAGPLAGSNGR